MAARLQCRIRDEVDDREWSALLARDPRAHALQRPEVMRLAVRHEAAARALWMEVRDDSGGLRAGMGFVRRARWGLWTLIAGPGGLYAGPVADDAEAEAELARAFVSHGGPRVVHRELVWAGTEPPHGDWKGLRPLDAAVLDVDPEAPFDVFLKETLPKNRRNEGNRSDRRGLVVQAQPHARSLASFHPLYVAQCREWGTPPLSLELLTTLVEELPEAWVFVAIDAEHRIVGAHVCIDLGDELFAWVGTTERRRDVFPSTVLIREEARWCHAQGRRRLNLGSSIGRAGIEGYKKLLGARWDTRWILEEDRRPWRRRLR